MKVSEVARILNAKILCCEHRLHEEVTSAFGADMMSDVLAFMNEHTLLLTGLVNPHVIRTAEMLELRAIVFVRGKEVPEEILERAKEQEIVLLATDKTLYTSCGLLYATGLPECRRK
ncbi:MAG TPA: DRTGG domain-containing protein [Clostridia bacterium]|nr:MAG: DRTGG domain protein [Firmicutes bacterium ADurb.Bin356]HOF95013.1 DRTGG domain-containing protein [Clostridia bacterium]HOR13338.1 DRTGG domain-containing protein [Clostridia bacterium]HPY36322.1 DRTGG domain-containing protein [Clostridia bacterium]